MKTVCTILRQKWRICLIVGVALTLSAAVLAYVLERGVQQKYEATLQQQTQLQAEIQTLEEQKAQAQSLESEIAEVSASNQTLETQLNLLEQSASLSPSERAEASQTILEQLYQEKAELLTEVQSHIQWCYINACDGIAYISGSPSPTADRDALADVVSDVTGLDSAGSAVSSIVDSIQNGESISSALENAAVSASEDAASDIANALLGKIVPDEFLTAASLTQGIFQNEPQAYLNLISAMGENITYHMLSLSDYAEREELTARDYAFLYGNLNDLGAMFTALNELDDGAAQFPDFAVEKEELLAYQKEHMELSAEIALYEKLAGQNEEKTGQEGNAQ